MELEKLAHNVPKESEAMEENGKLLKKHYRERCAKVHTASSCNHTRDDLGCHNSDMLPCVSALGKA